MLKVSEKYYYHILKPKITKHYQEIFRRFMKTKNNETRKISSYNKQVNNDNAPNDYVKRSDINNQTKQKYNSVIKKLKIGQVDQFF